jgi:hypothetical protein
LFISVKYFNDSSNSLGGAGGGGMTLSDVGSVCDLVCATVGFMRFVRVVVPLLLFVPYKF